MYIHWETLGTGFVVFIYTYGWDSLGIAPAKGLPYVFGSIALSVKGLMQFIRWVATSCVCTDIVLDGIISKLQGQVFCVKRAMNKVPVCACLC